MRWASALMGILALLGGAREAKAQFFFPSTVGVPNSSGGRTFTSFRHHHHFWGPRYSSFGIGYYPYYPFFDSSFYSAAFLSYPIAAPSSPLVINLPGPERAARLPAAEELPPGKILIKPGQAKAKEEVKKEEAKEKPEPPLPGAIASVYRPIQPADRERALQPVPPNEPDMRVPPQPVEKRPAEEPLPSPHPVEPAIDSKDLIRVGQEIFAAGEYGRAERFFRQATMSELKEALAFFLLAQARFAVGKYQEAVASIHQGMQLKPDWPRTDFQLLRLYDSHVADFQEQLEHLKEVTAKNPGDPALAFLYAHQLWFAGHKEEAKPFFQRAAADAKERDFVKKFLQE